MLVQRREAAKNNPFSMSRKKELNTNSTPKGGLACPIIAKEKSTKILGAEIR